MTHGSDPSADQAPSPARLVALHDAHHARLEDLLYGCLEAAVGRRADEATAALAAFATELHAGLALEDELVLPCFAKVGPTEGPGRLAHLEGDHVILLRTLGLAQEALAQGLADSAQNGRLRPVLEALPALYRVLSTLEHHTERERRHLYPAVKDALSSADLAAACARLAALVPKRPGS
jgi:hypothetical protein